MKALKAVLPCVMLALLMLASSVYGAGAPGVIFDETILSVKDGRLIAPRARHVSGGLGGPKAAPDMGWAPVKDGDYVSFDAADVFYPNEGSIEIKLTVVDTAVLGKGLEALLMLYDENGVPFFTIGMNEHDLSVGSFPLHPLIMEDAFGGTSFPYLKKLSGPLKDGTDLTIKVTWGRSPSQNRVYVNGKPIEKDVIRGPRTRGKGPGFEPTRTLGSFMGGFEGVFDGRNLRKITPPRTLTIGMDCAGSGGGPTIRPPKGVAIRGVRLTNRAGERFD